MSVFVKCVLLILGGLSSRIGISLSWLFVLRYSVICLCMLLSGLLKFGNVLLSVLNDGIWFGFM